jgi:uncharacterized protein YndB with AHSA1/START domain
MAKKIITQAIEIKAPVNKIWRVFTDPKVTRQMGGEYVTDWKAGSAFGWKGSDGKMYTHGSILQIEKERLLKHNLFEPKQKEKVLSVITYNFEEKGDRTFIRAQEELNYDMTDQQYNDAIEGWEAALALLKQTSEKL